MTLEEFDDALLRWGTDLSRWPDASRQQGDALLATSADAFALLDEMSAFHVTLEAAVTDNIAADSVVANIQKNVLDRIESGGMLALLPFKRILGWGSIAGVSGGFVAALLPITTGTSTLLAFVLGGMLP